MSVLVVTTFSDDGRALYGERMVETFRRHWPGSIGLNVYSDGWSKTWPGVVTMDLAQVSPWLSAFKERHSRRKVSDFRFDAVRFSHKVAAICHAARTTDADFLVWMDGDAVTHASVGPDALGFITPDAEPLAWLDRAAMYPECGFMVFNLQDPRCAALIDAFEAMYTHDALFNLTEWHDSFVLQHVVTQLRVPFKSLSGDARGTPHPLVNGPLGAWFDHLKGGRKSEGRSRKRDLVAPRNEAYWQ